MSRARSFTTNPLLFGSETDGNRAIVCDGLHPARVAVVSSTAVEIAQYFLEPHTVDEGIGAGFERDDLDRACEAAVLVPIDAPGYAASRMWEDRGWSRAAFLQMSQVDVEAAELSEERPSPPPWRPTAVRHVALPSVDITEPISLDALVRRRSVRSFGHTPMGLQALSEILLRVGCPPSWLRVFLVVQDVDGLDHGVYRYEPVGHRLDLIRAGFDHSEALAAVNFQPWVAGSGACAFLVAQWDLCSSLHPGSRGYIDLLIQVGAYAQKMLESVYQVGAGAWGTPAVAESAARKLLSVERRGIDALYAIKFGPVPAAPRSH